MSTVLVPLGRTPVPDAAAPAYVASAALGADEVERIGRDLDALRERVLSSRGEGDATYIRRVIATQRGLELTGRVVLLAGRRRPAWILGTACLTLAKVLDNMEIGHNVLHGQWDWMRDPKIHSSTWEWDHVTPAREWQRSHNAMHHVFTNIFGKDNDLGYGILRVDEAQTWRPRHLLQPLWNLVNACVFEYGVAAYDLDLGATLREQGRITPELRRRAGGTLRKAGRQLGKDFVVFPLMSGRRWRHTLTANATACLVRNLWSHSVIMCGHFPEGVETFDQAELDERETHGQWYVRQMLGSANISGSPLLHLLTGHLSYQIEHHLFPDLPSNRYPEIGVEVRALFDRHRLRYHSAPLHRQLASAWHKVLRLSLPNGWWVSTGRTAVAPQVVRLLRRSTGRRAAVRGAEPARGVGGRRRQSFSTGA